MKVLMINGSRRDNGCTYTALCEIAKELTAGGVEWEIMNVGSRVNKGEVNDVVNEAVEALKTTDAIIVGSPVYYASPSVWQGGGGAQVHAGSHDCFREKRRNDSNAGCAEQVFHV